MGLILPQLVETKVTYNTVEHYKKLNYLIPLNADGKPDYKATIKVHVLDLKKGSQVFVKVICDHCGEIYTLKYNEYCSRKTFPQCYCKHCYAKVFFSGENSYLWKDSLTEEDRNKTRMHSEYYDFVHKVLTRDNYTCKCCGKYGGKLCVHHLNGYDWFIEGRTDETNGVSLCENCHKNFHLSYGNGNNTKEQFEEWINKSIGALEKYNGVLPKARKIYCLEDDVVYDTVGIVSRKYKMTTTQIYGVCNHKTQSCRGYHFIWEEEYLQLSEEKLFEIKNNKDAHKKKVICTTTGKVFEYAKLGATYYGICGSTPILYCCKGKYSYSGKLSDGTELKWMLYIDFLKLPIEEQNEILSRNKESSHDGSFIM